MCTKQDALTLQDALANFNSDDLYVVSAITNYNQTSDLEHLRDFYNNHSLSFFVSGMDELGGFDNEFNSTFVTIGYDNIFFEQLPSGSSSEEIQTMIQNVKNTIQTVSLVNPIPDTLMELSETIVFDLEDVFSELNNEEFTVSIDENTDSLIVSATIENDILTLVSNNTYGASSLTIIASKNNYHVYDTFNVYAGLQENIILEDDFETSNLSADWQYNGEAEWEISNLGYESSYSAVSGDIANGEISEIYLDVDFDYIGGSVSFDAKISSEVSYDLLKFYIDDSLQNEWSGEIDWFEYSSVDLSAGNHILKWSYDKDLLYSSGSDCAWIDNVVIKNYNISNLISHQDDIPLNTSLSQNYPNPFNPSTKINYELGGTLVTNGLKNYKLAEIVVFNSTGQQVWSSPVTRYGSPVTGSILFDGSSFNSGIYYYSLIVDGKEISSRKMILMK